LCVLTLPPTALHFLLLLLHLLLHLSSGGGDHVVNLWRIASCSSAPWLGADVDCMGDEDEDEDDMEGLEQLDISRTTEADPPDIKVRGGGVRE
jgi:hypothetical protein